MSKASDDDERMPFEEWCLEQGVPPLRVINDLTDATVHARLQADIIYQVAEAFRLRVFRRIIKPLLHMTEKGVEMNHDPVGAYAALVAEHLKECQSIARLSPSTGVTVDPVAGD
jgi:hypothetical protein